MRNFILGSALLMSGLAGQARADISDSGNLVIGGQAVIGGTVTVQGNAFSVGGATLAVNGGRVGISTTTPKALLQVGSGTQSPALSNTLLYVSQNGATAITARDSANSVDVVMQASSSSGDYGTVSNHPVLLYTNASERIRVEADGDVGIGTTAPASRLDVRNGDIRISTTSGSRGIIFQDGTTQTSAASGGGGAILTNISTGAPSGSTSNSSLGPCLSGSTVTLTTSGNRVLLWYSGTASHTGDNGLFALAILQDGAFLEGATSGNAAHGGRAAASGGAQDMSFIYITSPVASGTHSWCLSAAAGSPSINVPANDTGTTPDVTTNGQFGALEVK